MSPRGAVMAKRKPTRKTRATKQPLQLGEYGPVVVCEGKYKGRVGYYDDDADDNINFAIVYFDTPFESKYVLIRRSQLARTAVTPLALEKWKREHPELAKFVGVP
jgi:hypothetical protein